MTKLWFTYECPECKTKKSIIGISKKKISALCGACDKYTIHNQLKA